MVNNSSLSKQICSHLLQNDRFFFFGSEIRFHDDLFHEIIDFEGLSFIPKLSPNRNQKEP
ncbi:hypothetical protein LEP1GSC038_0160 [Leptospira weilii str. 2006001855]|uniref:Uncharacterized protein n=1 Tax=Leptospira weilii str. 2006001855 TaxID=996804 RepID=M6FMV6_9LEPT|nr:hypothetical protein LEP1GSC038_0160 [Leptospira weilii str. 2006001855]OMI18506.1 hypothetical protein BUQ74_04455 [Leptospira weilii serovar Heyan]QDK21924.1 hypothetical protein FHG67_03595 [Leptospira weilii]QDK25863.1 hypothetical protein FHG68_03450 [Leptospira weilii]